MILESISDSSEYNIDDRQFYAQVFQIKVMGYIITKDDYRMDEVPLKISVNVPQIDDNRADVEIDEPEGETYDGYQKVVLTIDFPISCVKTKFLIDIDFVVREIQTVNVINDSLSISADDEPQENTPPLIFFEGSEIKMSIRPKVTRRVTKVVLIGYNPNSTAEHVASDKITANG